jgi:hypothetical protein
VAKENKERVEEIYKQTVEMMLPGPGLTEKDRANLLNKATIYHGLDKEEAEEMVDAADQLLKEVQIDFTMRLENQVQEALIIFERITGQAGLEGVEAAFQKMVSFINANNPDPDVARYEVREQAIKTSLAFLVKTGG